MLIKQKVQPSALLDRDFVEAVNNAMQLAFSFPIYFKVTCTNQLAILLIHRNIDEREHDLAASFTKTQDM